MKDIEDPTLSKTIGSYGGEIVSFTRRPRYGKSCVVLGIYSQCASVASCS
jgi:hypothetical protein